MKARSIQTDIAVKEGGVMDMNRKEVKFGEWIQAGFDLYKDNAGVLILATLVAVLLSAVTFGILAGPMLAGMVLIVLKLIDRSEPKPDLNTLFKGFDYFLNTFLFVLVWGLISIVVSTVLQFIPCVGQVLVVFYAYALMAALMFAFFLMVEKKMDFWPASMESWNRVKTNFWPFLGLAVLANLIGCIGAVLCGIGAIITMPMQYCILGVAYRDVFSADQPIDVEAQDITDQPETAPPPAGDDVTPE